MKPSIAILIGLVLPALAGCMSGAPFAALRGPPAEIPQPTNPPATGENPTAPVFAASPPAQNPPAAAREPIVGPPPGTVPTVTRVEPPAAPPSANATIAFTPITGAPPQIVEPLSRGLSQSARASGLTIIESPNTPSDSILKGYFSAFTDGDKTTVAYVWDVLDANGKRLHRIRGQEIAQGTAADPWAVVGAATMQAIAAQTIQAYLAWRAEDGSSG